MATLMIQLPGLPPVAHVLKDDTITVGRMKGNNIVIDDASVSLTHARITRHNGEFFLKDLNSTNGTVVNGQRINEARLRDLDRVAFADITAQFQAETAAEAPGQAPKPIVAQALAPNRPATASAPTAPVPLAPAPVGPVKTKTPSREPASTFSFARLMTRVITVLGGAVALGVVSFIGWKMYNSGFDNSPAVSDGPAAVKPVATGKAAVDVKVAANSGVVKSNNPSVAVPAAVPGEPETMAHLMLALRDPDPLERRRAATALHSMGAQAKEAAPALHEALNDTDQDVRMWSALTLVNNELHDKATIPILIGVLQRENPVLRQVACLSLGLIPYEQYERDTVIPALAETASKDGDDEVRKAAVSALNLIDPGAAEKAGIRQ